MCELAGLCQRILSPEAISSDKLAMSGKTGIATGRLGLSSVTGTDSLSGAFEQAPSMSPVMNKKLHTLIGILLDLRHHIKAINKSNETNIKWSNFPLEFIV